MSIFPLLSLVVSFLLSFLFFLSIWRKQKKYQFLPPGPAPIPLLGTPKYIGMNNICKYYPELRKKYGPIFTVWKLTRPVVVLCGYEVVKDALINHGEEFSGRPLLPVDNRFSGGYSLTSAKGERWRQLRRFTITSLRNFGMGRTTMEKQVLEESQSLIQAVSQTEGKPFNPINLLSSAIGTLTTYTLMGEHFDYKDPKLQEIITTIRKFIMNIHNPLHEFVNLFPIFMDVPILKQKIFKESTVLRSFVKKYTEEHKKTLSPGSPRDLIDYFLEKIKEEEHVPESHFCEMSLVAIVTSLLAGAIETTSTTLEFCLVVASNYPDVQRKVQQEIDEVTQSLRQVGIMDRTQMPYTNAVVHEIQRIFDLAPGSEYHAMTKDTQFRGYTLPKGTIIVPMLSSVLTDPTQWETPDEFNPGHFLDENGQFQPKPAFMVFSAGKRICPGESLARMELFLLFSALLQKFTFTQPPGTPLQDCKQLRQNKASNEFQLCATPRSLSS